MSDAPGVSEVTDADFARQVLAAELPVLVEFTADWCPPCRQMGPVLGALAAEEAGRLKVVQLNVDRNPDTTNAYRVLSMPTFLVFRDGEPVRSMVGARAKRRLLAELADVLPDVLPREAAPPGAVTS
ncbi:thioredoxin family protein [Streptomyces similanensis]|uniref:Thioredoxin n=1 Tax=Streptomyces similanensis TaxID=1274988 RepID=A0ABP9LNR2_9ACTN